MKRIDLNVDVAEGFPFDLDLLELATSANVCCGAHAGSQELALETVKHCHVRGIKVGAHPGIPDLASMGRGPWPSLGPSDRSELVARLREQVAFLSGLGAEYVKPHGTLYNASAARPDAADLLLESLQESPLPVMGLPGTLHETIAKGLGVEFVREGFADRRMNDEGLLMDRMEPEAVIVDANEAAAHALTLADGVDSLCVHGDSPGCVQTLAAVRAILTAHGYEVGL